VRQLLTESLLLALGGGGLGALLALWGIDALVALAPRDNLPVGAVIELDGRVLLFTFVVSLLTALLCGLWPAWQSSGQSSRLQTQEG
jgi:ABC-type antimicrobial peptide transport system permease subunit